MELWTFSTQVYVGHDVLERLYNIRNRKVSVICDPFLMGSDNLNSVLKYLREGGNDINIFSNIVPDPPVSHVVEGVRVFQRWKPHIVLVIGGGSAIDLAKAIVHMMKTLYRHSLEKFIAIPTTSGTGSEVTSFAVITDKENDRKYPLVNDSLLPDEALLTPLFVKTAPKKVTAYSGIDVLVHALEALVAKQANVFTDALAEKAIQLVFNYLPECIKENTSEYNRMKMHEASCLAGLAFNQAGLGIVHALSHQIGGQFHIPHGLANAIILSAVISYNAAGSTRACEKYREVAIKMQWANRNDTSAEAVVALIKACHSLISKMDIAMSLTANGIDKEALLTVLNDIVLAAQKDITYGGNPYSASLDDLKDIIYTVM